MIPYYFNGDRLKAARVAQRLAQSDLAKVLGVSQSTLSFWERGLGTPPADVAYFVSKYLKIDISRLFSRTKGAPSLS